MDPQNQQQGSSTDEEDCFVEDDATIAGPTKIRKRQQPLEVVNGSNKKVSLPRKAPSRSSQQRRIKNNENQEAKKADGETFARINKWVNESHGANHRSRQQQILDAINSQDEALKYWKMVNLPFEVKWSDAKKKAEAPPDPMQPALIEKLSSVEKERAANSNHQSSHFPTPEILAAQLAKQKLQADEIYQQQTLRHKQRQVFSPPEQIPSLDFNNFDVENHGQALGRARVYGRSDYDENNRAEKFELVSPDPEYHHMQNHNIRIDGICSNLREARKLRKKFKSDSERFHRLTQRADNEYAERNYRQMSLNTPELYAAPSSNPYLNPVERSAYCAENILPMSARIASNPPVSHNPLNSARYPAHPQNRVTPKNIVPSENVNYISVAGRKSPFFTSAPNYRNPVSFNLPANSQQLLSTIKQNYPLLLGLASQVLQKEKKSSLVMEFMQALEKRAELMKRKLRRLELNSRHALGDRRNKLVQELTTTGRNLKEYLLKIDDLRELLESPECQSLHHQGDKNHGHGTGQSSVLNQIRLLQQVFEKC